ncbi:putative ABC transport system ATP-binding protein [Segatella bryantii]|uniref:ABC transporter ATP-binding protein n=1 Tax=Segatella bryantii TaxID=77095 RepID=UPI0008982A68|nr:ABC transporter ATP-binding protein [Segatella bryantii]SEA65188.1 putative ABC transport system ATP-binding protein [Segatella bryantii]
MIKLQGIKKAYNSSQPLEVLKGVDLEIADGELVSLMGASGSGKSTLLNILGMLDCHDSGNYYIDGEPIRLDNDVQAAEYRSRSIGFVFQSFNLIPYKTALDNVALPLLYQNITRKQRRRKAMNMLERMGLKEWAYHLPSELSGGQKQRVAIARALIAAPKIILADEPTGALDSTTTKEVMELLVSINKKEHKTMLIVTHEESVARMCDRIVKMVDGKIV